MRLRSLAPAGVAALLGGLAVALLLRGDAPEDVDFGRTDLSPVVVPIAESPRIVARQLVQEESDADVCTGRIADADGAPVRGVEVALMTVPETTVDPDLRWLFDRAPRPLWSVHSSGRTDGEGRYSLRAASPSARTMLRIDSGGPCASLFSDLPQTAAEGIVDHGTLVLPRRQAFIGRVVDPRGRPVARAIVRLVPEFHLPWEGALSDLGRLQWISRSQPYTVVPAPHCLTETFSIVPTRRVRTDGNGRFRLFAAPGLRGTLSVDHQWFARQLIDLRLDDPSVTRDLGEIALEPSSELQGRVVDERGGAIPDAEVGAGVLAHDGSGLAYRFGRSDHEGAFRLEKLFRRDHVLLVRREGAFDWTPHGPLPVGGVRTELILGRGRTLDVRVGDGDGARIRDAELALHPADDERSAFETALAPYPPRLATDGTARIEGLQARPYRVAARAPGFAPQTGEVDLTRSDRELWITLDPECALTIRVVDDATGRGVSDAHVVAREVHAEATLVSDKLLGRVGAAVTDENGAAMIEHLGPGRYEVEVRHSTHAPRRRSVQVPRDDVVLGLAPGGVLTGRVTFRGRPLPGRRVVLRLLDRPQHGLAPTRIARTAEDGTFAFRGLPPGRHALDLRLAEGYVTGGGLPHGALIETTPDLTIPVAVQAAEPTHEEIDLERALGGNVRLVHGRLSFQGEPLSNRLVQAWVDAPDEGWSAATVTDHAGEFLLGLTDSDAVTVVVDALGHERSHAVDGRPIAIDVRGAWVNGVVRGRRAIAGARVQLTGPAGVRLAYTDAGGAFRFGIAEPGPYALRAEARGHVARTVPVEVPTAGDLDPIELTLNVSP